MERGKLIIIEGIDGSGKDTQQLAILTELRRLNIPVAWTAQPYEGCETGRLIRRILQHKAPYPGKEIMRHLFLAAATYQNTYYIQPMLESGATVICNRYLYSTHAYNVETPHIQQQSQQLMDMQHGIIPTPDMVIWLDISVYKAIGRMKYRDLQAEYYEKEEVLIEVDKIYRQMFSASIERFSLYAPILYGVDIVRVDATQSAELITAFLLNYILTAYFPEKL